MEALYFRFHKLEQTECLSLEEGRAFINAISDNGEGMTVGVFDSDQKVIYLDGFDEIIGADPAAVQSRVLRDLKAAGIEPLKIESLNPPAAVKA